MDKYCSISLKRIIAVLFIIASFYWWVFIPLIREILFFTHGRATSESVGLSLTFLTPLDVLEIEPSRLTAPNTFFAILLYYIEPMAELVAFLSTFFTTFYISKKMNGIVMFFIFLSMTFSTSILLGMARGGLENGFINGLECSVFPFLASLSGIGVAKAFLNYRPW